MSDASSRPSYETTNVDGTSADALARERTFLAAERTLFAVLRTGLAIAAGGTVIVTLLDDAWPTWVQISLATVFLVVGYYLLIQGLRRYHGIAKNVRRQAGQRLEIIPARTMTTLTVILQIAITVALALFFLAVFD
jgi:uncharacterized membrane protein YidH (DUF202 family)